MSKTKVQLSWRQHQTLKFPVDKELVDFVKRKEQQCESVALQV